MVKIVCQSDVKAKYPQGWGYFETNHLVNSK